ncbi:MAG: pyridoxal 5'-phosphate synthase glutaminase subunit PdxT [Bacillota bacterium]
MKIGVLAFQGAFYEHLEALTKIGIKSSLVKTKNDLKNLDGLIIPGGESTVLKKFLKGSELKKELEKRIKENSINVWGTCAGLIILSKIVDGKKNNILPVIDINTNRNAYGRQLGSFQINKKINKLGNRSFNHIFIRAPLIEKVGKDVQVISKVNKKIVAAEYKNILVTAFHPELTNDLRFHKYFLKRIKETL